MSQKGPPEPAAHRFEFLLCCRRILIATQPVRRLIFLDLRKTANRRIEAVVGVVVVALADLAQQDGSSAGLNRKIMIQALINENAFTGFQTDLRPGRNGIAFAVGVDFPVRFIIDFFIRKTIVHPDQYVAAAAVDDVLSLEPVEMVRCVLPFPQIQQLFRIDLRILVRHGTISVANRE